MDLYKIIYSDEDIEIIHLGNIELTKWDIVWQIEQSGYYVSGDGWIYFNHNPNNNEVLGWAFHSHLYNLVRNFIIDSILN